MSYRSNITLNTSRPDVQRDLNDRDYLHKTLMSLFPCHLGKRPRQKINLLFSVDSTNNHIVMQSDICPSLKRINQFRPGYIKAFSTQQTQDVGLAFRTNDVVEFKLSFAAQEASTALKKRVNISDPKYIKNKIQALLNRVGLVVKDLDLVDMLPIKSKRRGIDYNNAEVVGTGVVKNAEELSSAVLRGVGAGRVWGSGILLVTPVG